MTEEKEKKPQAEENKNPAKDQATSESPKEESSQEEDQEFSGRIGSWTEPIAIMMMIAAVVLDLISIIWAIVGLFTGIDDFGILDTTGFIVISAFRFIHSGQMSPGSLLKKSKKKIEETKSDEEEKSKLKKSLKESLDKTKEMVKRYIKDAVLGLLPAYFTKLVPYLGNFIPTWSISTFLYLIKGSKPKKRVRSAAK